MSRQEPEVFRAVDPASGEELASYEGHTGEDLELRLGRAVTGFRAWRETSFVERAERLRAAAALLRRDRAAHALRMTREMGKPIGAAEAEVEKCAWVCDYYAEHGESFLAPERVETDATESGVRYEPLGPVLAVMPWNFPYWQVVRFAAPALMAGNSALLKHASNVPGCSLALERLFAEAGFPEAAFQSLLVGSSAVADVIADPRVAAVTLTGSDRAGQAVAAEAGRCLKKTVLELGGSDPFIVLADVDAELVAQAAAEARTINSGQSCIAAKRFIVERPVAEAFTEALVRHMEALRVGDPKVRENQVGPLARRDLRDELHEQVVRSLAAGARLRTGGVVPQGAGAYYPPTVLDRVRPGQPAFDEELFGPVAAVIAADSREQAVELANASPYGLGASVWSGDPAAARELVPRLEAGAVFVNGIVKSDPRLPFGGVKRSGYGRELARFGIREFVNVKSYWIA